MGWEGRWLWWEGGVQMWCIFIYIKPEAERLRCAWWWDVRAQLGQRLQGGWAAGAWSLAGRTPISSGALANITPTNVFHFWDPLQTCMFENVMDYMLAG